MIRRLALLAALAVTPPALAQNAVTNALPSDPAAPSAIPTPSLPPTPVEPLFPPQGSATPGSTTPGSASPGSATTVTPATPASPPRAVRGVPRRGTTDVSPELRAQRRERLRQRWAQMTPEQREALMQRMRERRAARGLPPL